MTAPLAVRVERRQRQLESAGKSGLTEESLRREVAVRDERDRQREESPLRLDDSYTVVETADMSAEEAAALIVETVLTTSQSQAGDC